MGRLCEAKRLAAIVLFGFSFVALAPESRAAYCELNLKQFKDVRSDTLAMARRVKSEVYGALERKTCSSNSLKLLDTYIAIVNKLIVAKAKAYPCDDGVTYNTEIPNSGDDPQALLARASSARPICLGLLNSKPDVAASAPPASQTGMSKSASCSDITGTGGPPQAKTHCKDAGNFHKMARYLRAKEPKDPIGSAKFYKAAEQSYRWAGDVALADAMLREMAAASPVTQETQQQDFNLRQARSYATAGKAAEDNVLVAEGAKKNSATCSGLKRAAEDYNQAARAYFRATDVWKTQDELEKSDEFAKSNEMFRKRDRLNDMVDQATREGWCAGTQQAVRFPLDKKKELDPDKCKMALAQMKKITDSQANLGSISPSKEEVARNEALVMAIELAAEGCVEPGAKRPGDRQGGLRACLFSRAKWQKDGMSESEADRRASLAGCGRN